MGTIRLTKIDTTLTQSTWFVPRANFANARHLPSAVGHQSDTRGIWKFGVQVRFTFNQSIGNINIRRSQQKTYINNDLYFTRFNWHFTDKYDALNATRVVSTKSGSLAKARLNYKTKALIKKNNDAPNEKNVYANNNIVCIMDGPGEIMMPNLLDITDPLTTYHLFEAKLFLKSGSLEKLLGHLKFDFFMEKESSSSTNITGGGAVITKTINR